MGGANSQHITVGGIIFDADGYVIKGNAGKKVICATNNYSAQGVSWTIANVNITFNSPSYSATMGNILDGTRGFTLSGGGRLILIVNNIITGTVTNASSTLQIGDGVTTASGSLPTDIVNNGGSVVFNRPDILTHANVISGSGSVTNAGAGPVVFTGAHTYSGATVVAAGKLYDNNALSRSSAVSVAAGATFGGTGSAGDVSVANGGAVEGGYLGSGTLQLSSLAFAGGGTVVVSPASGGYVPLIITNGLTSVATINISLGNLPPPGTLHILEALSGSFAGIAGFALAVPDPSYALATNGNYLDLVVTSPSVIWTGAYSTDWSTATFPSPKNWKLLSGGSATDFQAGNAAIFDDTATANFVNLTASVSASGVTFSNTSRSYTLGGPGALATSGLTLQPGATAAFSNAGALTLLTGLAAGSSSSLTVANAADNTLGIATLTGGTLQLANMGSNNFTSCTMNGANVTLTNGAGNALGILSLNSGALTLANNGPNTFSSFAFPAGTLTINQPLDVTFPAIASGAGQLVKRGANLLTLTGTHKYGGGVLVSEGTLMFGGTPGGAPISGGTISNYATVTFLTAC